MGRIQRGAGMCRRRCKIKLELLYIDKSIYVNYSLTFEYDQLYVTSQSIVISMEYRDRFKVTATPEGAGLENTDHSCCLIQNCKPEAGRTRGTNAIQCIRLTHVTVT